MRRRDFTILGLASLAFTASRPAWATEATPELRSKITAHRSGTTLFVSLAVENAGDDVADLFVKVGERPAPQVVAYVMEGEASFELTPIAFLEAPRQTRAGPIRTWAPLAASESMNIGTYRFTVPERYADTPLPVEIRVQVRAGQQAIDLPATQLAVEA